MTSEYDLSLAPDSRFLTFRQSYTTQQHLTSVYEAIRGNAAINAAGFEMMDSRLSHMGDQLQGMQWAIEDGFYMMADAINGLRDEVRDGFLNMERVVTWGVARICWEHEQDREVYREILHVLKHPLETQALEHRERAEKAIANKWWAESVGDLDLAVQNNKYDYLAHLQIARVLWFEYGYWELAMEHFQLAAKYADAVDASPQQKYYAAVAHLHVALLWRMDAKTLPEHRDESLAKATAASARAYELMKHELPMAVVEHVLVLLTTGRTQEAIKVMWEAVNADESVLLSLESSPDLTEWREVEEWVRQWRESQPVEEVRRLADQVQREVTRYCPDAWKETDSLRALRGELLGAGVRTRQVLVQAVRDAQSALSRASAELQRAVARTQVHVILKRREVAQISESVDSARYSIKWQSERNLVNEWWQRHWSGCLPLALILWPVVLWDVVTKLPKMQEERRTSVAYDARRLAQREPTLTAAVAELDLLERGHQQAGANCIQFASVSKALNTRAAKLFRQMGLDDVLRSVESDRVQPESLRSPYVNQFYCEGCGVCTVLAPSTFELTSIGDKRTARVIEPRSDSDDRIQDAIDRCPNSAIEWMAENHR